MSQPLFLTVEEIDSLFASLEDQIKEPVTTPLLDQVCDATDQKRELSARVTCPCGVPLSQCPGYIYADEYDRRELLAWWAEKGM